VTAAPSSGSDRISRRQFLAYASVFGWIPFFRSKHIKVAGGRFRIIRNGRSDRRYLVIHGNEESAREVLTAHMRAHTGRAFIVEGTKRNIPVAGGQIDPNRMFSRVGAEANLRQQNPGWTTDQVAVALTELAHGRNKLVEDLMPPKNGVIVALHNNSPEYSVANEQLISDAASIREPDNLHAFFLCTNLDDFRKLAESPYNVVLQSKPKQDDGSLSRLAAGRGVRYINLEVRLGQTSRQKEMLDWLEWNIP
jgi:hypothetical protein